MVFSSAVRSVRLHFQSDAHHDDCDHQGSQTNQVELLGEQLDQFIVTALGGDRGGVKTCNSNKSEGFFFLNPPIL